MPSIAHAQLYVWNDASGRQIISGVPKDPSAKTYTVLGAAPYTSFRSTRPASARSAAYDDLITQHANTNALSPDFVRAVIQAESGFNPRARSLKGAMGLMQLMPGTAADYGVTNAYDPAENIKAGTAYLKSLMTRFNNDVSLALAAYNAGPQAVEKYGRTVPPYKETRNYVQKITSNTDAKHAVMSGTPIYRVVRIINGHEVESFSGTPSPGATLFTGRR